MSQTEKPTDPTKDDQLAEFADQVLNGKLDRAFSSDEELLRLEETILRLKHTLPPNTPNEAASKQMLARLKARMEREERTAKPSFWKRLFDFQSNPQIGMIMAVVAVIVLVVISAPLFTSPGSSVTGTASSTSGNTPLILGIAGVFLLVIFWLARRK